MCCMNMSAVLRRLQDSRNIHHVYKESDGEKISRYCRERKRWDQLNIESYKKQLLLIIHEYRTFTECKDKHHQLSIFQFVTLGHMVFHKTDLSRVEVGRPARTCSSLWNIAPTCCTCVHSAEHLYIDVMLYASVLFFMLCAVWKMFVAHKPRGRYWLEDESSGLIIL